MTIEIRRRGMAKQDLVDPDLDPRRVYIRAVISEFEADPEAINPFDHIAVFLLYWHYREKVKNGDLCLSLHNLGTLIALDLKIRHGIFRTEQALEDLDSTVAARFVDKAGKLKKVLDQRWQSLVVDTDTLVVSPELKKFLSQMRRAYFLKLQYIMFVSSLPYFPSLVVEGKLVLAGKKKTKDILIGVGKEAILVIDEKSGQPSEQYAYSRILSWAFSKELFSFRFVSERGASRRGAEEVIFITPDAQMVSEAVQRQVDDLFLLESPFSATIADTKKALPKLMDEFLQQSLLIAKQGGSKQAIADSSVSQEKKLRQISGMCAQVAEKFSQRIAAGRTRKNHDEIMEMKKKTVNFLHCVNQIDKALKKAGRDVLDVTTTVQLRTAMKAFAAAVEQLAGEDVEWKSKLDEVIKRAEEM